MIDGLAIICGDALSELKKLPDKSIQCCVTSPPYFGLRDYKVDGQIGNEFTPAEYVNNLVAIFHEVRRVLAHDGTLWLNLGDSYANDGKWGGHTGGKHAKVLHNSPIGRNKRYTGLKPKDLIGIPWRVAFALQADGWYLRSDIIWHKPNPMPESAKDRPTKSHEYIFLLSKSKNYYYDADTIAEPSGSWNGSKFDDVRDLTVRPTTGRGPRNIVGNMSERGVTRTTEGLNLKSSEEKTGPTKNKRDVWTVATDQFSDSHFATFPKKLITPCVLAGCPVGGTVLDPFAGSGTTGEVCLENRRKAVLIELNPEYIKLIEKRCDATQVLLA